MKILFGCFLFLCSIVAKAEDEAITVNSDQATFAVRLDANPTTGYNWSVLKYDKQLFSLTNSTYLNPKEGLIGAGGQMLFNFTLNKGVEYPDETIIVFKYARPWDPQHGSIKRVIVSFEGGD